MHDTGILTLLSFVFFFGLEKKAFYSLRESNHSVTGIDQQPLLTHQDILFYGAMKLLLVDPLKQSQKMPGKHPTP